MAVTPSTYVRISLISIITVLQGINYVYQSKLRVIQGSSIFVGGLSLGLYIYELFGTPWQVFVLWVWLASTVGLGAMAFWMDHLLTVIVKHIRQSGNKSVLNLVLLRCPRDKLLLYGFGVFAALNCTIHVALLATDKHLLLVASKSFICVSIFITCTYSACLFASLLAFVRDHMARLGAVASVATMDEKSSSSSHTSTRWRGSSIRNHESDNASLVRVRVKLRTLICYSVTTATLALVLGAVNAVQDSRDGAKFSENRQRIESQGYDFKEDSLLYMAVLFCFLCLYYTWSNTQPLHRFICCSATLWGRGDTLASLKSSTGSSGRASAGCQPIRSTPPGSPGSRTSNAMPSARWSIGSPRATRGMHTPRGVPRYDMRRSDGTTLSVSARAATRSTGDLSSADDINMETHFV